MYGALWIEMLGVRCCRDNNATVRGFDNIVAKSAGHRIQRQSAVDKPLDKI